MCAARGPPSATQTQSHSENKHVSGSSCAPREGEHSNGHLSIDVRQSPSDQPKPNREHVANPAPRTQLNICCSVVVYPSPVNQPDNSDYNHISSWVLVAAIEQATNIDKVTHSSRVQTNVLVAQNVMFRLVAHVRGSHRRDSQQ